MKLKWVVIPAVIAAVAITMFYPKKNRDIPVNLIGKWTTSAPGYQDYFFELTKETIIYGRDGDEQNAYIISSLGKNQEGKNIVYTINYKSTDVKFTRSFYYDPANEGKIQFKHQEHIEWHKTKDSDLKENSETDQN
jgi:hypothetical protein